MMAPSFIEESPGSTSAHQNISNPNRDPAKYADVSGEKMKALVWNGPRNVSIR